jgi:hypothetical protein
MRLNGWVRIGIIASVAWVFVGGYLGNRLVVNQAAESMMTTLQLCNYHPEGAPPTRSPAVCGRQANAAWDEAVKDHWWAAAIVAFVPIPFAWLLVWGLVALVRWVRARFATK